MEAVIVKTTGKIYSVRTLDGRFLSCILKGKFRTKDIKSTNPKRILYKKKNTFDRRCRTKFWQLLQ